MTNFDYDTEMDLDAAFNELECGLSDEKIMEILDKAELDYNVD